MNDGPVTVAFRVDRQNPGHTFASVFIGRNVGARGHSGQLTIRTDEWNELVERLGLDPDAGLIEIPVAAPAERRALDALREVYDDLYPVGAHRDDQWGSASDYLEWMAGIVLSLFGPRPTDDGGNYVQRGL